MTLFQEEEVKIVIGTKPKKPFRKSSYDRNSVSVQTTEKTEVEQKDENVAPVEEEQSTKRRKFPIVKRNK